MARIKFGGIISDISGSVGGATFQRSLYGTTLRNKPLPIHKRTASQERVRSYLQQLHASWRTLTPAERLQWQQFISFSNQSIRRDSGVLMSGHDLFIKYNMFRFLNGMALMTVPTYESMPVTTYGAQVNLSAGALILSFPDSIDHTVYWFICRLSPPRLPSRSFSNQGLRFMKVTLATDSEFDISALYIAAFGALPSDGDYVHISVQFFSVTSPLYFAPLKSVWEVEDV